MLDGENNDFLVHLIDRVLNEVGILSGDQFTHACNGLCSTDLRKQNQILERMENSRAYLLGGGRTAGTDIIRDGSKVLRRTRRKSKLH
jgi:hypothetical protein